MAIDEMSAYERKAFETLMESAARREARRALVPPVIRDAVTRGRESAIAAWDQVPGNEQVEDALKTALTGLQRATTDAAMRTVNLERVAASYRSEFPEVTTVGEIRNLDLRACDVRMAGRRTGYTAVAAGAGAATSLAVTGAVVSTTVSGGTTAAVAIGAIAADVAGTLAGLGRIIGLVAARYGYDVREPEEEVFAAGVLSLALAGSGSSKVAALRSLSKLTQDMMRRATWTQLRTHTLVGVIDRVYLALGLRLTQQKLAQAVPILGVGINAGLNIELTNRTFRRAMDAYRLRFLTEKYALGPDDVLLRVATPVDDEPSVPDVAELVAEAEAVTPDENPGP